MTKGEVDHKGEKVEGKSASASEKKAMVTQLESIIGPVRTDEQRSTAESRLSDSIGKVDSNNDYAVTKKEAADYGLIHGKDKDVELLNSAMRLKYSDRDPNNIYTDELAHTPNAFTKQFSSLLKQFNDDACLMQIGTDGSVSKEDIRQTKAVLTAALKAGEGGAFNSEFGNIKRGPEDTDENITKHLKLIDQLATAFDQTKKELQPNLNGDDVSSLLNKLQEAELVNDLAHVSKDGSGADKLAKRLLDIAQRACYLDGAGDMTELTGQLKELADKKTNELNKELAASNSDIRVRVEAKPEHGMHGNSVRQYSVEIIDSKNDNKPLARATDEIDTLR